jgi:nickel-type superoxide dismutase maturation protease
MKLPYSFRQVSGTSMEPTLKQGRLLIITRKLELDLGDVVIVLSNNLEIVKRISKIDGQRFYIVGDNPGSSTDSRTLGWFDKSQIIGKVIWPKHIKMHKSQISVIE